MSKFKVGDKVRILGGCHNHYHIVGSVGEITYVCVDGDHEVEAEDRDGDGILRQLHPEEALELVNHPLIDDEGEPVKDDLDTYMVRIGKAYVSKEGRVLVPIPDGVECVKEAVMNFKQAEDLANTIGGEVVALTTVPVVEE